MILLIVTVGLFFGLLVSGILKIKQKVIVLGGCVILLVVCNFLNQLAASATVRHQHRHLPSSGEEKIVEELTVGHIGIFGSESAEERGGEFLEEEREMVGYLWKRWQQKEFALVHFENLHKNRLKSIIEMVNHRINNTHPQRNILLYHLDYNTQDCDAGCLKKTFSSLSKEAYVLLLVENIRNGGQLTNLEDIYTQSHLTIIFQNTPKFFGMHTISRLTYRFPFSNNYLPKILQQHPSKTIQHCSLYRSFDYHFYAASMTVPLLELCVRALPSTPAVKCVKKYLTEQKMRVPENWVRKCLAEEGQEGLILENGWVGVKKEYFWSGKVNRTELLQERQDL